MGGIDENCCDEQTEGRGINSGTDADCADILMTEGRIVRGLCR